MARTEEKEVIHLLPIKDKTGVIPQSVERGTTLFFTDWSLIDLICQCEDFTSVCLFAVVKKQMQEEEQEEEEEEAADELEEFENGENDVLFVSVSEEWNIFTTLTEHFQICVVVSRVLHRYGGPEVSKCKSRNDISWLANTCVLLTNVVL